MDQTIHNLLEIVETLDIEELKKAEMISLVNELKKDKIKYEFKHNRFIKDKTIVVNLLNSTIEDLEHKSEMLEIANKELLEQGKLIEHKNTVLEIQKKRIEDQSIHLEENLEKLTESYSDLEQFTYIASHDLKSPLRTITNFGQLLKRRLGPDISKESKDFLEFIIKGAKQMNTVICDLLEFARIGNENKEEHSFSLKEVMETILFNLMEPIKEHKATLIYDDLPQLQGMQSGIIHLFQNLIGNAIKFKKEKEPPVIKISVEDRGSCYYFEVADNGMGMEEEYQEKAFLPFQRINHLDRPGTGMGLAICKKIITQHGGDIWYRSILGIGTTFCFTLNKITIDNKILKDTLAQANIQQ